MYTVVNQHPATANLASTDRNPAENPLKELGDIDMVGEFVGRESDLERLDNLLNGPYHFITIHGFGGIGKTSLALQVAERFNAGKVLALPLVGTPKLSDVIRKIARFLNINVDIIPNL